MLGSTSWGAWDDFDAYGNDVWVEADGGTPIGDYPNDAGPLQSESAANGWIIFDASQFQIFQTNPLPLWGYLISPAIEINSPESIIIEWTQYFRYCCGWESPLFLEVSIDEGASWNSFPAHGDFVEASDWTSENPMHMKVDIGCVAAEATNIQFRFAFNPQQLDHFGYDFWGIDDVLLRCSNESDKPELNYLGIRVSDSPYEMRQVQTGSLVTNSPLKLDLFLTGHTFIDSAILHIEVEKDADLIYQDELEIGPQDSCTINPFHAIQAELNAPLNSLVSSTPGEYTFTAKLYDPISEQVVSQKSSQLTVNPSRTSNLHTSQVDSPAETFGNPELPITGAWTTSVPDSICALQFANWQPSSWGQATLELYNTEPGLMDPIHTLTEAFDNPASGNLTIFSENPITEEDETIMLTINPSILSIAGTYGLDVYRQNRQWVWNRMNDSWEWQHGAFTPYLGFETMECQATTVNNEPFDPEIYPNPTSGKIRLIAPLSAQQIIILNPVGQRVGEFGIDGQESITLDLNFLSEGAYFLYFLGVNEYGMNRLIIQK